MKSSLQKLAEQFAHSDNLQDYTFVFPNQRAGLFFRKYLASAIAKPMFAPSVMSINQCFAELSDLRVADQLTLLLRLYSIYQHYRPNNEGLERFIYWGKMMLTDFSEIDNHRVEHVQALFANIRDLHEIDERFSYLTPEQRTALARFWKEFADSHLQHPSDPDDSSSMLNAFLHTWDLLLPLYNDLRQQLKQDGLAYEGMLHREVIDHWQDIPSARFRTQYVFIGFNALTTTERQLIINLQQMGRAELYFDYESDFLHDSENKASLFLADNLKLSSQAHELSLPLPAADKPYTLVEVASTVGQVHEINRILRLIAQEKPADWTRTVVVLPDEQLLLPLLHAIPADINKINVTMGYPLRATSLYTLVANPTQLPDTLTAFFHYMRQQLTPKQHPENSEALYLILQTLDRLEAAVEAYPHIAFTVGDIHQLLKLLTMEATIPYIGEPLQGLQIMGVLETRALDFDNVIIADFNDDLYPGRSTGNSFIPYTLRCGFGMPTPDRQNAVFAYNFYRMISYAKRVWFISNTAVDDTHSGERSRYYYQLKWQYGIPIKRQLVQAQLATPQQPTDDHITKDHRIDDIQALSATMLNTYLRCPKSFYYKYIERLKEPEPDESISASELTIGSVLHAIMEHLYQPYVGQTITAEQLRSILSSIQDDAQWNAREELNDLGQDVLARGVMRSYVMNILEHDMQQAPFRYLASETKLSASRNGKNLYGYADRLDVKTGQLRIIDYKTGYTDLKFRSMDKVFGIVLDEQGQLAAHNHAQSQILQTLLYCWMATVNPPMPDLPSTAVPHIYPVRALTPQTTTAIQTPLKSDLELDSDVQQAFLSQLDALINEIFDKNRPYSPCVDTRQCEHCAFLQLCKA